ncbi:MAG TPA: hypothetical protein VGW75_04010 [Solirubrobacteraceae bacterium]|nr:hypothetical protein [Solirubrobacteraceae bacterium]
MPISMLTKEPRRNFDLRDEGGRSLPVLGRRQNGDLAHVALMSTALDALPAGVDGDVFEGLTSDLRRVVFDPPPQAREVLGQFIASADAADPWRRAIVNDATCRRLLASLWSNYVLFAVLPLETARRRVIKYSYGDDIDFGAAARPLRERLMSSELADRLAHPDRRRFSIECPGAWRAASFHVEIAVPEELRIHSAVLYDRERDLALSSVDTKVNRAALYASTPIDETCDAVAHVGLVPERAGRTTLSAATALTVAALLWLGVASGLDVENPGAAISLLLGGAALFSGLMAAQGPHRIVQRTFAGSRRSLALVAFTALTASASLAMEVPERSPVGVWRICALLCSVAALRLVWSAVRAAP